MAGVRSYNFFGAARGIFSTISIVGALTVGGNASVVGNLGAASFSIGSTLFLHNTGTGNTFVGESAGNLTLTGTANVAIGYQAGMSLTVPNGGEPQENVLIGWQAGKSLTTARGTICIGAHAGKRLTGNNVFIEDGFNVLIGELCGEYLTVSMGNVILGQKAGENLEFTGTLSQYNVMMGTHCGTGMTVGSYNTLIGNQIADYTPSAASGDNNVAVGSGAFGSSGLKHNNVMVGFQAGNSQTVADDNVFVGRSAGQLNLTGTRAVYIGRSAGTYGTGSDNTYIGYTAGVSGTTAVQNTGIGSSALSGASLTTGSYNVCVGYQSGVAMTTGERNTLVGHTSGSGITTGTYNTVIGHSVALGITTGSANTIIGANISGLSGSLAGNVVLADGAGNIRAQCAQTTGLWTIGGGLKSTHATAGVGYGTGAGGTVTQGTSKSTGVTLNTVTGAITLHNASLNDATNVSFSLTNSAIAATDLVHAFHSSGGTAGAYQVSVTAAGSGSCQITVRNVSGGALGEAIVLTFVVFKGVTS